DRVALAQMIKQGRQRREFSADARRVFSLSRLANHSVSGGTSLILVIEAPSRPHFKQTAKPAQAKTKTRRTKANLQRATLQPKEVERGLEQSVQGLRAAKRRRSHSATLGQSHKQYCQIATPLS